MSANLTITKSIEDGKWSIYMVVANGADIPSDIFLYTNNDGVLGDFVAVCSLADYLRFRTYMGVNIPVFGNKYLKKGDGHQMLDISTNIDTYIAGILNAASTFRLEYLALAAQNTTSHPI